MMIPGCGGVRSPHNSHNKRTTVRLSLAVPAGRAGKLAETTNEEVVVDDSTRRRGEKEEGWREKGRKDKRTSAEEE